MKRFLFFLCTIGLCLHAQVDHLIVIFQENWSFQSLYGTFSPEAPPFAPQTDLSGTPYPQLVPCIDTRTGRPYPNIPPLPNAPFDLAPFFSMKEKTGDLIHDFYQEQFQINGGKMDRFAAWSDAGGLAMSFYDIRSTRMGKLAQQYTLCDRWFHSCFGGSMCGALWLFSAQMPKWPQANPELVALISPGGALLKDGLVSPDGFAVNDAQPWYPPFLAGTPDKNRVPPQEYPTIGDRLDEKGISWGWYAEGWDDAVAGRPDPTFPFHHQAPVYFKQYAPGTKGRSHLRDLKEFERALKEGKVPAVSFIRSLDRHSEHPGSGSLLEGLDWCADWIEKIQKSSIWKKCAIIVTYDENGGRWDPVAPPVIDRFGPGTRVPALIISPFTKGRGIDHTTYETVSILKWIESRFGLKPLSNRDANATNIQIGNKKGG